MRNIIMKRMAAIAAAVLTVGTLVGCGGAKEEAGNNNKRDKRSIMALGSSALQPLAEVAAKDYMKINPNDTVNVQGGGSGAGIKGVLEGSADIGNSDVRAEVKLGDSSEAKKLVDHEVCGIGFAMVASKDVTVKSLSKEEIQKIFKGEIKNWKEVGGEDKEIILIHRKSSSGTRLTFINKIMDGESENKELGITNPESGAVREAVKVTQGAISYLALSYIRDEVRGDLNTVAIDGVDASNENIINGDYPFWSFEHMYTNGEAVGLERDFIDFMTSEQNAGNVEKLGYIPMNKLK